jgi:hypothetical protein
MARGSPGQQVAASGLEELDRLACDPDLRAAKDEVQEEPGDRSGDERHGQHLLLHVAERADDRCRVTPDRGDRVRRPVGVN